MPKPGPPGVSICTVGARARAFGLLQTIGGALGIGGPLGIGAAAGAACDPGAACAVDGAWGAAAILCAGAEDRRSSPGPIDGASRARIASRASRRPYSERAADAQG